MGAVPAYSATNIITSPTLGQSLCSVTTGPGAFACSYVAYYTSTLATTPVVGASAAAVQNTNPFPATVVITAAGASISNVSVNGITVGVAAGTYIVPSAAPISITYTGGPPTWVWTNQTGTGSISTTTDQDNIALQSDPVTASAFVTADTLIQQPILNAPLIYSHYLVYAQTVIRLIAVAAGTAGVSYHVQLNAVFPGPSGAFL